MLLTPAPTYRTCECGEKASYAYDVPIGSGARTVRLYLCPACYVIELEMELATVHPALRPGYPTAQLADLASLVRAYIVLQRRFGAPDIKDQALAHAEAALASLRRMEHCNE